MFGEIAKQYHESSLQYGSECHDYWNSLTYEDKLKAFSSVVKRIVKGDIEDKGTYRYVLYDVFGFEIDSYLVGMECGYLTLHNYIGEKE